MGILKIGSISELEAALCGFSRDQREAAGPGFLKRTFSGPRNRKVCLETSYLEFCADSLDPSSAGARMQGTGRRAFDSGCDRPVMIVSPDAEAVYASEDEALYWAESEPKQKLGLKWMRAAFFTSVIALATLVTKN